MGLGGIRGARHVLLHRTRQAASLGNFQHSLASASRPARSPEEKQSRRQTQRPSPEACAFGERAPGLRLGGGRLHRPPRHRGSQVPEERAQPPRSGAADSPGAWGAAGHLGPKGRGLRAGGFLAHSGSPEGTSGGDTLPPPRTRIAHGSGRTRWAAPPPPRALELKSSGCASPAPRARAARLPGTRGAGGSPARKPPVPAREGPAKGALAARANPAGHCAPRPAPLAASPRLAAGEGSARHFRSSCRSNQHVAAPRRRQAPRTPAETENS